MPPLRERTEDIPELVAAFIEEFGERMGKRVDSIPVTAIDALRQYRWPGNVRELRNVIERAMIQSTGTSLKVSPPKSVSPLPLWGRTIEEVERLHITRVLSSTEWRVRGDGGAAEILGMKPTTLESRMKKLQIMRPR
jgi:transcriptional regulator with GAF, ATPase, and Fis domain